MCADYNSLLLQVYQKAISINPDLPLAWQASTNHQYYAHSYLMIITGSFQTLREIGEMGCAR